MSITPQAPKDEPTRISVRRHGKKLKCTFFFTARNITKIFTPEQLEEYRNSDSYFVHNA